jgi:hypothetical protein
VSSAQATVDLDDTEGLLEADRDGLLRASAQAGAQVRATASAVDEGALESITGGQRPRTVIWVGARGAAEAAGAMLTAALSGSAAEPLVIVADSPPWVGPLDVLVAAGDDPIEAFLEYRRKEARRSKRAASDVARVQHERAFGFHERLTSRLQRRLASLWIQYGHGDGVAQRGPMVGAPHNL